MSRRPASKRVTLNDVARAAGVSVQTASHVMANNMSVRLPETTRQKVKEAAKNVGYRPNRLAQAMKSGRTNVIALWIALDRPSMIYLRMLHGFSTRAHADGYDLMIIGLESSMAYAAKGPPPNYWPVDGMIAVDAGKSVIKFREDPNNDGVPVCVLGFEEYRNADSVGWSVRESVQDAIARLISSGLRSIVHVTPDWVVADYPREQRRTGYAQAMEAAGLEPEILACSGESSDAAETAVIDYLKGHSLPQAFFGFTDTMAIGAARAIHSLGYKIPEDCAILGFGDSPESRDFRIPLTTLRTPIDAVLDQAWRWLLERVITKELKERQTVFPMELVVRESTPKL